MFLSFLANVYKALLGWDSIHDISHPWIQYGLYMRCEGALQSHRPIIRFKVLLYHIPYSTLPYLVREACDFHSFGLWNNFVLGKWCYNVYSIIIYIYIHIRSYKYIFWYDLSAELRNMNHGFNGFKKGETMKNALLVISQKKNKIRGNHH